MLGVSIAPLLMSGVVVLGEGPDGCPSAREVSARLSPLLFEEQNGPPDAVIFDGETGALRVRLVSAAGSLREQKTLDLRGSCDELADAVATVAVAWRSRLQSQELPPPPVLLVNEVFAAGPPRVARAAPPYRQPDLEVSLGIETAAGSERWAPALVLGAQAPLSGPYSMAFSFSVAAPRGGEGALQVFRWVQMGFVAGPSHRSVGDLVLFDAQVGLGSSVNAIISQSLSAGDSWHFMPPAMVAGARWSFRGALARPWFGCSLSIQLDPDLASPVHGAAVPAERWQLGVAMGGTVPFDGSP